MANNINLDSMNLGINAIQCAAKFTTGTIDLTETAQSIDVTDAIMIYFAETVQICDTSDGTFVSVQKFHQGVTAMTSVYVKGSGTLTYILDLGV